MAGKRSVAIVIWRQGGEQVLTVLRPHRPDDELRGKWGLPAVTLRPAEDAPAGAVRCGREKLGIEVAPVAVLGEARAERASGPIALTLVEARALSWPPNLPDPATNPEVTLYEAWDWKRPAELRPTAEAGSLCCRLLLELVEEDRVSDQQGS
ncbi:MAG: NUDIX hydrolase [Chloroflexota bacterium]|nr:NUDIX hydrolase [Dehalococcoidia bacterium]MDW8047087.1 NUDIX hydrolase [Chloroflexota bacterium]